MAFFSVITSDPANKNHLEKNDFINDAKQPFFKPRAGREQFIQRKPDEPSATRKEEIKKPDLSSISAKDPASTKSHPPVINSALMASSTYSKYVSSKLKDGGAIDAPGKFVIESSIQNFVNAYNKCFGTNVTTLTGTNGFYCSATKEIHLVPNAEFGTAFHESVHKSSALAGVLRNAAWTNEPQFAFDINEGLTSFYTKEILTEYKITNYTDGYASQRQRAAALIKSLGEDEVAKFYFQYSLSGILSKLGISISGRDVNVPLVSKLKSLW
ncbi:MAG TPA: hypothetical protein VFW07_22605 [Parafilimonas sp.]|nr:hypothetical protein [Parafilimonas sp.]